MIDCDVSSIPKSKKIYLCSNPRLEQELNHAIEKLHVSEKNYKSYIIALVDTLAELVGQSSYFKETLKQELSDHDLI